MKKKLLFLLSLVMLAVGNVLAEDVQTITFKESGSTSDGTAKQTTVDGIISTGSEYVSTVSATNVYQGRTGRGCKLGAGSKVGSLTLTLATAVKPTKIVFTAQQYNTSSTSITVNGNTVTGLTNEMAEYTIDYDGATEVSKIEITTSTSCYRAYIGSVSIYSGEVKVAAPTITGDTPFFGTNSITLACATEGASIYYTTDGTAPTSASTPYSAPFEISATTTVKAIAINGTDESSVSTKTFTAGSVVANVAALNALADKTAFQFTGEAYVVAAPTTQYTFIKDETGSSLIYGTTGLTAGQYITAGWTGTVSIYNSLFEAVPTGTLTAVDGKTADVTNPEATAAEVVVDNANQVVTLKGVTYTAPESSSNKNFTITSGETSIAGYNTFGLTIAAPASGSTYDIVGVISRYKDNAQFLPITITKVPDVLAVMLEFDNTSKDIYTELEEAKKLITDGGDKVGNIEITLSNATYTVSGTLEAPGSITITGTTGSVIDASALTTPLIQMSSTPAATADANVFYAAENVSISNVKVTGLANQLFYANKQRYLITNFTISNSVIQVAGGKKTVIDTNGGGVIATLNIKNSTIYSNPKNEGALYSSQSGQKATDAGLAVQTFNIENNTFYNIANAKNLNSHRSANQKWLTYVIKNNIALDCGKQGQFVKGFNGGQQGPNPVWDVDNNSFLFTVGGVITDQSASETNGDTDEPVKNSLTLTTSFKDLENGDFTVDASSQQAKMKVGDPRWLVEFVAPDVTDAKATLKAEIEAATKLLGEADVTADPAKTLKEAIDAAQTTHDTAEFNELLNAATTTLKAAEEAYNAATGITNIDADAAADRAPWYTINGVRISKPAQKGLYIHNGKKVIIK